MTAENSNKGRNCIHNTRKYAIPLRDVNQPTLLETVCENATVSLFVMDENQQCIYMNPAAENLTGYKMDETIGRPLHDVVHHTYPDGRPFPIEECAIDRAFPANNQEQGEEVFVHKDGSFYHVAYTASPVIKDGHPIGTVIEVRSLEKKLATDAKIARDEALLAATFENAAVGIAHVGFGGEWIRVNKRLCEIVGYSKEELTGLKFQDVTHPDDLDADLKKFAQLTAGEIDGYEMQKRYYRKDGERIWINLTTALQKDERNEPLFCIAVIEDITDKREKEKHLHIMANELNHRVKNTLATIQAIARISLPEATPGKEEFVERIISLSRSHDLLLEENWSGANIYDVVEQAMHPFGGLDSERIVVEGKFCKLSSKTALALSLALNELGTNAVKYGALSGDTGQIIISWSLRTDEGRDFIDFDWQESGGPKVVPPTRQGFGTILIKRALASEMSGETSLDYDPAGVKFRCSFPNA